MGNIKYSKLNASRYQGKKQKINGDLYKDVFAVSCGNKQNSNVCYNQVIQRKQNNNGYRNETYNYSTRQMLSRKCLLFKLPATSATVVIL